MLKFIIIIENKQKVKAKDKWLKIYIRDSIKYCINFNLYNFLYSTITNLESFEKYSYYHITIGKNSESGLSFPLFDTQTDRGISVVNIQ